MEGTIPAGTSRDFTLYRETDPGVPTDKNITLTLEAPDTGALLYADGKTPDIPPLVRVAFHCQQAEHQYAVTVTIDGTQVDAQTNLSGPYSKTFPLP